jgi:hypothetical protein
MFVVQATLAAGNPYWKGRLSTVDLLVLTSLDQLLLILPILFSFFTNKATLMRRSTVLSLPLRLVFPVCLDGADEPSICLSCLWKKYILNKTLHLNLKGAFRGVKHKITMFPILCFNIRAFLSVTLPSYFARTSHNCMIDCLNTAWVLSMCHFVKETHSLLIHICSSNIFSGIGKYIGCWDQ